MKRIILLFTIGLISYSSYGQDPQLIDNNWYLHNLILDGENHIPYNIEATPRIEFFFDTATNEYNFSIQGALENFIYEAAFHPTDPEFSSTYLLSFAKGPCIIPEGLCFQFFDLYEPFYFDYQETPMAYEITENGDGTQQLIVTNIDGDQAVYNTFLLANETQIVDRFKVAPNPTSGTLLITSNFQGSMDLTIYSISGTKIMKPFVTNNRIDVSTLATGLYFLEIRTENGGTIKRFIKE